MLESIVISLELAILYLAEYTNDIRIEDIGPCNKGGLGFGHECLWIGKSINEGQEGCYIIGVYDGWTKGYPSVEALHSRVMTRLYDIAREQNSILDCNTETPIRSLRRL